jgi:hypothetical protein
MALTVRRVHGWTGALFAPALLFFAASGLLQVFDLHKARPGADREPPAVVVAMAQLHKNQLLAHSASPEPRPAGRKSAHTAPRPMGLGQKLLKGYAAGASVALAFMTLTGVWLGLRNRRERALTLALLALGVLLPLGLVCLG